ncbi:MAG: hypothetical protein J0I06_07395 [Planctomycetes bacterium]|nr:hypothetical protein [Planctomycetota bacterium]
MIPKSEFQNLIREVVETCIPDEADAFDSAGDELVDEIYHTGRHPDKDVAALEFKSVDRAKELLAMAPLLIATYKALKEFFYPGAKKQTVTQEIIQKEWSLTLRAEGLPPELVGEVTAEFSRFVSELVTKYSNTKA